MTLLDHYHNEMVHPDDHHAINRAVHLLIEYFTEVAGNNPLEIHPSQWTRLGRIVDDTRRGEHLLWVVNDSGYGDVAVCGLSRTGELSHGYVVPSHRQRGIGTMMVEERIKSGGWWASVLLSNTRAMDYLTSRGFSVVHRDIDRVKMVRGNEMGSILLSGT